jgi:hypothetical protein
MIRELLQQNSSLFLFIFLKNKDEKIFSNWGIGNTGSL